jgi:hypothetical protein
MPPWPMAAARSSGGTKRWSGRGGLGGCGFHACAGTTAARRGQDPASRIAAHRIVRRMRASCEVIFKDAPAGRRLISARISPPAHGPSDPAQPARRAIVRNARGTDCYSGLANAGPARGRGRRPGAVSSLGAAARTGSEPAPRTPRRRCAGLQLLCGVVAATRTPGGGGQAGLRRRHSRRRDARQLDTLRRAQPSDPYPSRPALSRPRCTRGRRGPAHVPVRSRRCRRRRRRRCA